MGKPEVLHEQSSDVGTQGEKIIRSRVPTQIIELAGGTRGDSIRWQTIRNGEAVYIVGEVVKGGAQGRVSPAKPKSKGGVSRPKAAASKGKQGVVVPPTSAKGKGKSAAARGSLADAFSDAEDWSDDVPASTVRRPAAAGVVVPPINRPSGNIRRPVRP